MQRRPDREVYQVRKRRSRSRSSVVRSGGGKRHSDTRSKRRSKRSLSPERDRARSRSPRRRSRSRSRSRSPTDKRKKSKVRRRSTERKSKKKKKARGHKKTRVGDKSRSRSVSPPATRDSREIRRRSPEAKKSKKRSPSRSASRSRSRSLFLSGRDSAVSKDDVANKKSSKSPENAIKRRKRKAHDKPLKDRIGEVVVIDSSRENSPVGEGGDASGKDKEEKEVVDTGNKETKEKQISAKGENLVINVNFRKKKLLNIFGDDASDEEPAEKSLKDDKAATKSCNVSPASGKKGSPVSKGPQTPPSNTAGDEYDPCEPLADSPGGGSATPTNDERDQQPLHQSQPTRIPGLGSPSPPTGGRDSPATLPSHGHGKPTVAVLPIVDNKSPRTKDQRGRRSPVKNQQPPQPPLPPPQNRDKPPSPAPPPALAPPPVPSFLFSQPPPAVQPQYIVMNPYLVNPYHAMMPMQAATAPLVAPTAPVTQVSLATATGSRDTGAPAPEGSPYSPGESPLFNEPITPPTPLSAEETAGVSPVAASRTRGGGVFDQIAAGVTRQSKRKEKKKHKVSIVRKHLTYLRILIFTKSFVLFL